MVDLTDRFWSKVSKPDGEFGCWEWTGALNSRGYGQWAVHKVSKSVHRLTYTEMVGPIPDGMVIDHLCRVRHCCNPAHLEVVTNAENMARGAWAAKTHCPEGHPYSGDNLIQKVRKNGTINRLCRTCTNTANRARYAAAKRAAA